jgi:hypothetical protein
VVAKSQQQLELLVQKTAAKMCGSVSIYSATSKGGEKQGKFPRSYKRHPYGWNYQNEEYATWFNIIILLLGFPATRT